MNTNMAMHFTTPIADAARLLDAQVKDVTAVNNTHQWLGHVRGAQLAFPIDGQETREIVRVAKARATVSKLEIEAYKDEQDVLRQRERDDMALALSVERLQAAKVQNWKSFVELQRENIELGEAQTRAQIETQVMAENLNLVIEQVKLERKKLQDATTGGKADFRTLEYGYGTPGYVPTNANAEYIIDAMVGYMLEHGHVSDEAIRRITVNRYGFTQAVPGTQNQQRQEIIVRLATLFNLWVMQNSSTWIDKPAMYFQYVASFIKTLSVFDSEVLALRMNAALHENAARFRSLYHALRRNEWEIYYKHERLSRKRFVNWAMMFFFDQRISTRTFEEFLQMAEIPNVNPRTRDAHPVILVPISSLSLRQ